MEEKTKTCGNCIHLEKMDEILVGEYEYQCRKFPLPPSAPFDLRILLDGRILNDPKTICANHKFPEQEIIAS